MATKTSVKVSPLADRVVVQAARGVRADARWAVHPRHRQGKAAAGRDRRRGTGPIREGKRVPMDVKVGDKVLYGKYSGTEVTIDGEQLLILRESDVLAVIS